MTAAQQAAWEAKEREEQLRKELKHAELAEVGLLQHSCTTSCCAPAGVVIAEVLLWLGTAITWQMSLTAVKDTDGNEQGILTCCTQMSARKAAKAAEAEARRKAAREAAAQQEEEYRQKLTNKLEKARPRLVGEHFAAKLIAHLPQLRPAEPGHQLQNTIMACCGDQVKWPSLRALLMACCQYQVNYGCSCSGQVLHQSRWPQQIAACAGCCCH